jgi:hypothetical protein
MDIKQILTEQTSEPEPLPDYLKPDAEPRISTIRNSASLLEHKLVETLLDILDNGQDRDRLNAADKTADILGKKSKAQVLVTDNLNIQNNNNFLSHFQEQARIAHEEPECTP